MNWTHVRLIWYREVRDQLRDKRTLFVIAVLPVLLYPLMGMGMLQVVQFSRDHSTRVLVLGADDAPEFPALFEQGRFRGSLFDGAGDERLLEVTYDASPGLERETAAARAQTAIADEECETVLYLPSGFRSRLCDLIADSTIQTAANPQMPVPQPEIFFHSGREKSLLARSRVARAVAAWTVEAERALLDRRGVSAAKLTTLQLADVDLAQTDQRDAAMWSRLFPFLLLIWALTGAFYPAIDLCAGEKERGTLETLLIGPAERRDIVCGKLLTIMGFSVATAVLNLLSMLVTGCFVLQQVQGRFGPPPPLAPLWVVLTLFPVAALFSALCLALASFARSTKEGQYYLMPLVVVAMPLVMLPMAPTTEINLGYSLIPLTGIVLLLRTLLEGNHWTALQYAAPVIAVTALGCWLSIRWAVDQFSRESVLFRECERLDLSHLLSRLRRDRRDTPTFSEAILCGMVILAVQFFLNVALAPHVGELGLERASLFSQLAAVAAPAILMTLLLTRSPRQTLLLRKAAWWTVPAAAALAFALHPLGCWVNVAVQRLYPLDDAVARALSSMLSQAPSLASLLVFAAIVPAICEELAFRGFILSGLRHLGSKWQAIAIASFFFGAAHGVVQQSIVAGFVGMVLGYLAVQTSSLLPCVAFHATHNSLGLLAARWNAPDARPHPYWDWMFRISADGGRVYDWPVLTVGCGIAAAIFWAFSRINYNSTDEERWLEAIRRQWRRVKSEA